MSQQKIKVFLGAYINTTNAQNLNCLALAEHLDKTKFKVYALELYSGNLESKKDKIPGVKIFNCFRPFKVSKYLGFLWGVWHCDVAYLPKGEIVGFNRFWLKLLNKKSFSTVEGILDDIIFPTDKQKKQAINNYRGFTNLYAITAFMRDYNYKHHNLECDNKILYLGTDFEAFEQEAKKKPLTNVLLIGNDLIRKGVYDFLKVAQAFPDLNFHIAGTGNGKIDVNKELAKNKINNVTYHGGLSHTALVELLKKTQLHILPSRSEGFPKVTLETAAAGVPSVVYADYGASEWITHNKNGFVVESLEHTISTINYLQENSQDLQAISKNAIALAQSFDWKVLVKDWEEEIIKLYQISHKDKSHL